MMLMNIQMNETSGSSVCLRVYAYVSVLKACDTMLFYAAVWLQEVFCTFQSELWVVKEKRVIALTRFLFYLCVCVGVCV